MEVTKPAPRVELDLQIGVRRLYSRSDTPASLTNISLTGASLALATEGLQPKDKIKLKITVADRVRLIAAEIIWINAAGIGVKFLPKNSQDLQIIDDLIYFVETKQIGKKNFNIDS